MPTALVKAQSGAELYDRDFFEWTVSQANALRRLRPGDLDWENVAEEIESLGRSDKSRIESNLNVLILHLLKWRYQPQDRSSGWKGSIVEHRGRILKIIKDSPSLRTYPAEVLPEEYISARLKAAGDTRLPESTFPETSPFTI